MSICSEEKTEIISNFLEYKKLVAEYENLRKAILENNVNITKRIISDLTANKEAVINFTPKEENSLLFMWVIYVHFWNDQYFKWKLQKLYFSFCSESFRACQNGNLDQVNCLISAGAKCTAHKSTKCTPLYASIRGGHVSIVRKILTHFPEAINVSEYNYFVWIDES